MAKEKTTTKTEEVTIDAKGKILGRVATQAAFYLQGKHKADYEPHVDGDLVVRIQNASRVKVTGKKKKQKMYWNYSGYPGGLYGKTYEEVFEKDPRLVIEYAVKGMLPKNRLQKKRLKRLVIEK